MGNLFFADSRPASFFVERYIGNTAPPGGVPAFFRCVADLARPGLFSEPKTGKGTEIDR
jgi:hypothetical protein